MNFPVIRSVTLECDAVRYACRFSRDRRYRYTWHHCWDLGLPPCGFIGLNPSTADEHGPDPTVRRCINYAKSWGYGSLTMLNLFAYRATDPQQLFVAATPVGRATDRHLVAQTELIAQHGGMVVAAWGNHGMHRARAAEVRRLLSARGTRLHYLVLTQAGEPGHPLYLRQDLRPLAWPDYGVVILEKRRLPH